MTLIGYSTKKRTSVLSNVQQALKLNFYLVLNPLVRLANPGV